MLNLSVGMVVAMVAETGHHLDRGCNMMTLAVICSFALVFHNCCCSAEMSPYLVRQSGDDLAQNELKDFLKQSETIAQAIDKESLPAEGSPRIDNVDNGISKEMKQDSAFNRLWFDKRYGINMFHGVSKKINSYTHVHT